MKIVEKIKNVLRLNPEVVHNRARLRAMYYLVKNHPKKYYTVKEVNDGVLRIALRKVDNDDGDYTIEIITCIPLNNYRDGGYKNL